MRICATVLLGPGSESIVSDAIASVANVVDGFVLIDGGGGEDAVRCANLAVCELAPHLQQYISNQSFEWTGSYAEARNYSLRWARALGYDYAMTLDPDERIVDATKMRAEVESHPDIQVFIAKDRDEGYSKERILRLNAGLSWHGRVNEYVRGNELPQGRLSAQFWELQKSRESAERRHKRGIIECRRMIDEGDDCFRWRRHLGTCLIIDGQPEEGFAHLQKAIELAKHPEDKSWVRFLMIEQHVLAGDLERARREAADALVEHAGFLPEYAYIFAFCEYKAGNLQNAERWAQVSAHCPDDRTRLSFRGNKSRQQAKAMLAILHGAES